MGIDRLTIDKIRLRVPHMSEADAKRLVSMLAESLPGRLTNGSGSCRIDTVELKIETEPCCNVGDIAAKVSAVLGDKINEVRGKTNGNGEIE